MLHGRAAGGDRDRLGVRARLRRLVDRLRRRLLGAGVERAASPPGSRSAGRTRRRRSAASMPGCAVPSNAVAEQVDELVVVGEADRRARSGARSRAGCSSSPGTGGARTCPSPAASRPEARYAAPRSSMKRVGEWVGRAPAGLSLPRADSEPPITLTPGETRLQRVVGLREQVRGTPVAATSDAVRRRTAASRTG